MAWRVAKSLDVLLAEINAAAPNRSKVSDGAIGDAAHATRDSDHNPWLQFQGVGVVTARDFTHDPRDGLDCHGLAAHLVDRARNGDPRPKYVIWNGRIISSSWRFSRWRTYQGPNKHTKHLHLSVSTDPDVFDSAASWGWGREWDEMATKQEIKDAVADLLTANNPALLNAIRVAIEAERAEDAAAVWEHNVTHPNGVTAKARAWLVYTNTKVDDLRGYVQSKLG